MEKRPHANGSPSPSSDDVNADPFSRMEQNKRARLISHAIQRAHIAIRPQ
jgi:hypothetical protein